MAFQIDRARQELRERELRAGQELERHWQFRLRRLWLGSSLVGMAVTLWDGAISPIWWATDKLARRHERSAR